MVFKLKSVTKLCNIQTCLNHNFARKPRFSSSFLIKREFCSKNDSEEPPDGSEVEKLLKSSSPLRSSNIDDFWASSPYPHGTVFSDIEHSNRIEQEPPVSKSVILFPGQGNQFVGMAKNLLKYPVALDLFKTANDILGYNLLKVCLEGPEHKLNNTICCQPATFVCSLALLEKVKEERPWAISNCIATCGYSLGELTALVFAGCMNFEKGLNLVKVRAEAMAECCKLTEGGMLTVLIGLNNKLSKGIEDAVEHCKSIGIENPQCNVASYLFPNCMVVAGNKEALDFLKDQAKTYGIRRHSTLPVSGAFHTLLMKPAVEPFLKKLRTVNLIKPKITVFSNVTGKPYRSVNHILSLLPKQVYSPVKWQQIMQYVLSRKYGPLPFLYECGPGNSLTAVAAKVNNLIAPTSFAIQL